MDERRHPAANQAARAAGKPPGRVLRSLTREQAIRLLRSVPMGRIAFTYRAMPAIRPVNHVIDEAGLIVIRSHEGTAIVRASDAVRGTVVSYEADHIDTGTRSGWTVVATGLARIVDDPAQAAAYRRELRPWVTGQMDYIVRVEPTIITAYEMALEPGVASPPHSVFS